MTERERELECVISDLKQQVRDTGKVRDELLEALQVMVRDYTAAHADSGSLEMQPALLQASQAIAKATGEQP